MEIKNAYAVDIDFDGDVRSIETWIDEISKESV